MNTAKLNYFGTIIKVAFATLFFFAGVGCSYETLVIRGKVVDESGTALNDVSVWACYSGWGRSDGHLVWDKDYCSETVQSDNSGVYVLNFKGPISSRLRARKEGWVQTLDFNTTNPRITLTKSHDYSANLTKELKIRQKIQLRRLPEESESEYYCRAILTRSRSINLNYQGQILKITTNILNNVDRSDGLFALHGSSKAAYSFSKEAVLMVDGTQLTSEVSLSSDLTGCDSDVHFMRLHLPNSDALTDARIEMIVPGISAMFDMELWSQPVMP